MLSPNMKIPLNICTSRISSSVEIRLARFCQLPSGPEPNSPRADTTAAGLGAARLLTGALDDRGSSNTKRPPTSASTTRVTPTAADAVRKSWSRPRSLTGATSLPTRDSPLHILQRGEPFHPLHPLEGLPSDRPSEQQVKQGVQATRRR